MFIETYIIRLLAADYARRIMALQDEMIQKTREKAGQTDGRARGGYSAVTLTFAVSPLSPAM
ncbi:MAG: hypothetical protein J1F14_06660 [Treponema sp.]|nr:hypothetical protein [Treponema sp.]